MPLEPNSNLLHYRLIAQIGEGGMGEVWKATDTTLDREVAIKILPAQFAADAERLARFEREAKLLASLNHPNIAAVYGLHEAPSTSSEQGVRFLAMELVDGEDLSVRLQRGALPVEEALEAAGQIAEALEAAHGAGVIHRDLKPANIIINSDGQVKVLDFGLAKAMDPSTPSTGSGQADPALSPTLTSAGTVAGMILGTASYMSPEQARGKPVDRRADIWSFGAVLYEMLTGRRAFPGETITDVIAAVVKEDPDWSKLPDDLSPTVIRTLLRCLAKKPKERFRDIGDVHWELTHRDETDAANAVGAPPAPMFQSPWARIFFVMALVLIGALLGKFIGGGGSGTGGQPGTASMPTTVLLPDSARIAFGEAPIGYESSMLALSPDGNWLVYAGKDESGSRLYRKDLTSFADPEPIAGTDGALIPVFSPDGNDLAFLTWEKLVRVGLSGDRLQVLAGASTATMVNWSEDGYVYFAEREAHRLSRVPENGGETEELVNRLDRGEFAQVLPHGGKALVSMRRGGIGADDFIISLFDLATKETTELVRGGYDPRYAGDGRLVFCRGGALMAVAFDPDSGAVTGEPSTLEPGVAMDSLFAKGQFAFSSSGLMAYVPGKDKALGRIAWVEEGGRSGVLDLPPRIYGKFDLDDTDRRLAIHVGELTDSVLVYDMERKEEFLISGKEGKGWPRWSHGGDALAFYMWKNQEHRRLGVHDLKSRTTREIDGDYFPEAWIPGDEAIVATLADNRIVSVPLDGGELLDTGVVSGLMDLSRDGRWAAHSNSEGGVTETLVWSWPDRAVEHRVGDGIEPRFTADGDLFFRKGGNWFKVDGELGATYSFRPAVPSFQVDFLDTPGTSYDITADGSRMYYVEQAVPSIDDRVRVVMKPGTDL